MAMNVMLIQHVARRITGSSTVVTMTSKVNGKMEILIPSRSEIIDNGAQLVDTATGFRLD